MLEAYIGKFTYDSANRLVTAGTRYYAYDVEGTRIKTQKGEDTTKFIYNVNARLSQLLVKVENNADTKYVYGLGLIGEETSGNFKTYHFDYRGSTVAITNASGTVTDTFEYDTYGKLKSRTGTTNTPFLYNGRDGVITEDDTGLYYMRARYYSPVLRRFINADIVAGSIDNAGTLNRYAYCNGDPVSYVDPFGLSADNARGNQSNGGIDISSWYTEDVSNAIHNILDVAGFIPGFGAFSDALNSIVYALEGDWYNAGMSALAVIPGLGDIAKGIEKASKLFRKSGKIYKALNSASKFISKIDDVLGSIASISRVDDTLEFAAKNSDEVIDAAKKVTKKEIESQRKAAIKNAWLNECMDIKNGGHGISRVWSDIEITELLEKGKVKGYEGHHMKSIKGFPELAGDPNNIQFLTRSEHFLAHGKNWRNITNGRYIP